jgi:hypothetical protein
MLLYLVNYTVPAPISNGGLIAVAAEDDYQCLDILVEDLWDSKYQHLIMPAIESALKFELLEDVEAGIVENYID